MTEHCILGNVLYITVLSIITNCSKVNKYLHELSGMVML